MNKCDAPATHTIDSNIGRSVQDLDVLADLLETIGEYDGAHNIRLARNHMLGHATVTGVKGIRSR